MIKQITHFDVVSFLWFNRFHSFRPLTNFFRGISHTGDGHIYIGLAVLALLSQETQHIDWVKSVLLAFLFELPIFMTLKVLFKRARPFVQLSKCYQAVQPSDEFSIPSGHTAAAFLVATLIAYFYIDLAPLVFVWASLIGISRVFLGVHYPTDIAAGAVLGIACSSISLTLLF